MAYNRLPPIEVCALDETMNRATGVIPYESLIWTRRFKKCGEFQMVVRASIYEPSWAYIYTDDRPEMGIIQSVQYDDSSHTEDGEDTITVAGFFLECIFNRIVFLDESPEKQKVYVPKPRRPTYSKSSNPKVYVDPMGDYYFTNSAGDVISADDGRKVSTEGLTVVDYKTAAGQSWGTDTVECSYSYYDADKGDEDTITKVSWSGSETTYNVAFRDDRGNVFFKNGSGTLEQATGVVEKRGDTYYAEKKRWDALADDDPYGRYYLVDVKGPWQRTEMLEPVTVGDSIDIVMRWTRRMIGDWVIYVEPDIQGVQKSVDPSFQYLGDLLYATLNEVGASMRIEYSFEYNAYFMSVYKGKDRTQGQSGNPWAVFSDTWGALYDFSAKRDESNYKNTCYVLFDYDKPKSFDSTGWPVAGFMWALDDYAALPTMYGIAYESNRGYNTEHVGDPDEPVSETYLDLRNEKPSCDGDWSRDIVEIPGVEGEERESAIEQAQQKFAKPSDAYDMKAVYDAYEAALPGRGVQYLKDNYYVVESLDTGIINTDRYLKDFDLGDKVDMVVSTVGMVSEAQIIEVEEQYDKDGGTINVTLGDETLNNIQKARLP